jgi:hypothetical protein
MVEIPKPHPLLLIHQLIIAQGHIQIIFPVNPLALCPLVFFLSLNEAGEESPFFLFELQFMIKILIGISLMLFCKFGELLPFLYMVMQELHVYCFETGLLDFSKAFL